MKMTAYFAYAFAAPFAFCVAAHAQDALPGAPEPTVSWTSGTLGIAGGALRNLGGSGKLEFSPGRAHITGDATSDEKGVITYSNVTSGTTTAEYFEGEPGRPCRVWAPGALIGLSANGRSIAVLKGSGTLHINLGGVGVTGDVTADGKGGYLYANVKDVTTKAEYWDGTKWWEAGAVLAVSDRGKIRVVSGTPRSK